MKAKKSLPKKSRLLELEVPQVPERPLSHVDIPLNLPEISEKEVLSYVCARDVFILAKLDYERKRGELLYKLRMLCTMGPSHNYTVKLAGDNDEIAIIVERASNEPRVIKESLL